MEILVAIHVRTYLNQAIVYVSSKLISSKFFFSSSIQVALVYSSNDPINFICAFYGCLLAGIVPLPIDVPLARRVRINEAIKKRTIEEIHLFSLGLAFTTYWYSPWTIID